MNECLHAFDNMDWCIQIMNDWITDIKLVMMAWIDKHRCDMHNVSLWWNWWLLSFSPSHPSHTLCSPSLFFTHNAHTLLHAYHVLSHSFFSSLHRDCTHSSIHPSVHSFIHPSTYSSIYLFIHSSTHSSPTCGECVPPHAEGVEGRLVLHDVSGRGTEPIEGKQKELRMREKLTPIGDCLNNRKGERECELKRGIIKGGKIMNSSINSTLQAFKISNKTISKLTFFSL